MTIIYRFVWLVYGTGVCLCALFVSFNTDIRKLKFKRNTTKSGCGAFFGSYTLMRQRIIFIPYRREVLICSLGLSLGVRTSWGQD